MDSARVLGILGVEGGGGVNGVAGWARERESEEETCIC